MKRIEDVIRRPIITEKTALISEGSNKYVFEVDTKANKQEIKEAVSTLFGVRVLDVNTAIVAAKPKRFGRHMGRRRAWKKAVVTLAEGNTIEYFENSGVDAEEQA